MFQIGNPGFLRSEEVTLAEVLSAAGYAPASIGKWHLGSRAYRPDQQGLALSIAGYDHGSPPSYFYPYRNPKQKWNSAIPTLRGGTPGEYLTDRLTGEAIRFVEACGEKPFFLYLPHYAVHTPLQAPAELVAKYEKKLTRERSQKSAVYGAMVEPVDRCIGRRRARGNQERPPQGGQGLPVRRLDTGAIDIPLAGPCPRQRGLRCPGHGCGLIPYDRGDAWIAAAGHHA